MQAREFVTPPPVGTILHAIRKRKRLEPGGHQRWSRRAVSAVAQIGADRLYEIEHNVRLPTRDEIATIGRALELTPRHIRQLIIAAGYLPRPARLTEDDIRRAVAEVQRLTAGYGFPVSLLSVGLRVHWMNAPFLALFGLDEGTFNARVRDHSVVELNFQSPMLLQPMQTDRGAAVAMHYIQAYRGAWEMGLIDIEAEVINALKQHPLFYEWWEDAGLVNGPAPAMEQARLIFERAPWGELVFDAWWSPLASDHRFFVDLALPRNAAARAFLRDLASPPTTEVAITPDVECARG